MGTIASSAGDCGWTEPRTAAIQVGSFGVNGHVKLPGPTQHQPNVYNFGTPYEVIYRDLRSKDEAFYEQKGLLQVENSFSRSHTGSMVACVMQTWLSSIDSVVGDGRQSPHGAKSSPAEIRSVSVQMLQRNMSIKLAPQRWQDNQEQFDVVIVFEERLMDNLLEGQQPWKCPIIRRLASDVRSACKALPVLWCML